MFLPQVDEFDKQTIEPDQSLGMEQLLETKHHLSYNALKKPMVWAS